MDDHHIKRLESALSAAVARHRSALRHEIARCAGGFELRFLLARLGIAPLDLDAVSTAGTARDLPPVLRSDISARLSVEAARLTRLARAGAPTYDLNRHIAVRRALLWVAAPEGRDDPAEGRSRASGRAFNSRFSKHRPPRRPRPPTGGADPRYSA